MEENTELGNEASISSNGLQQMSQDDSQGKDTLSTNGIGKPAAYVKMHNGGPYLTS